MKINKIVALLKKGISLDRVQENRIVFLDNNEEFARLLFDDKVSRDREFDLGFLHEHEIKFIIERKLHDGSGSMVHGLAYLETEKDFEFFANQVIEFVQMDERILNRFVFKSNSEF